LNYHIKLKNNNSSLTKFNSPHRITPVQREELRIQINKLLDAGIIEHPSSSFAAPAFLVKKKEPGSYRLVVDYKEINDRVIPDNYTLPRTQDLFRAMEGMTLFSTVDLNSGFFQVPISNADKELLAFITVQGLFTFNRLPKGFKNSSAVFQRIINKIFSEHLYKKSSMFY